MKLKFSIPFVSALKKCSVVACASILMPGAASAAPVGTPDFVEVTQLRGHWDTNALVVSLRGIDPASYNPAGCTNPTVFSTADTNPGARELRHSMLMSAYLSGTKVRLIIDDTTCCSGNAPLIIAVQYEIK